MAILVLEDKLGITEGYMQSWASMCLAAGLRPDLMKRYSAWRSPLAKDHMLLTRKGNRKSPGFNPDPHVKKDVRDWVIYTARHSNAEAILCMDVALLGIVEGKWDIATIDNLRGGVYDFYGIPWLVTVPISAIHNKKSTKDIKAMNDGHESEDDFEEDDERDEKEIWIEPYLIPFGKWLLSADLRKLHRILEKMQGEKK